MHRSFLNRASGAFGYRVFSTARTDMWRRGLDVLPPRRARPDGAALAVVSDPADTRLGLVDDPTFGPLCDEVFARGDVLHLLIRDGSVLGWRAVSTHSHVESVLGLHVDLEPGDAYSYALWVDPEVRGGGLGEFLVVESLHEMADSLGARFACLAIDRRNKSAQSLMAKIGYHPVDSVRCVRVFGHGHELGFTHKRLSLV